MLAYVISYCLTRERALYAFLLSLVNHKFIGEKSISFFQGIPFATQATQKYPGFCGNIYIYGIWNDEAF